MSLLPNKNTWGDILKFQKKFHYFLIMFVSVCAHKKKNKKKNKVAFCCVVRWSW